MRFVHLSILSVPVFVSAMALTPAAAADPAAWLTRCNMEIGDAGDPESARYLFETQGTADGAMGRAEMDYSADGPRNSTTYPTAAKDLMNPYGGASLHVGYYGLVGAAAPYAVTPKIGHVGFGAIAKDFRPLPGHVTVKLVVDGTIFGPYEPKPSSASDGQYSVWLDTAETDGDRQPPLLKPAQFAALAKAVDAMKAGEVVIVQDGIDVARLPVSPKSLAAWRDGLPKWASATRPGVGAATVCSAGGNSVN